MFSKGEPRRVRWSSGSRVRWRLLERAQRWGTERPHPERRDVPMDRNPPSLPMLRTLLLLPMLRIDAKLPILRSDVALATDSTLDALNTLQ
jgi:hypothetical protein